jgi:glycosyltransferase involved in cell wall biosynthesis
MISVIIPSRNEPYLTKTVDDILAKARGDIEVITVLDGYWDNPANDKRVTIVHRGEVQGMRANINSGVAIAKGDYILKCDAHCMFDEGFDVKLLADMEDNWIVVPRRKRLDAENWTVIDDGRPDVDYMYLSADLHGVNWDEKNNNPALKDKKIDDLMSSQGSCWFMKRDYFYALELLDEENYGSFWNEFQEIGLKCWLSGGRVVVNKNTWYAHLHKQSRGYSLQEKSNEFVLNWLYLGRAWDKQTLPIEYLIDKFSPVPGWNE